MATPIEDLYVGDGSTVLYSFTFPYIAPGDIKVTLDGTLTTEFTFANITTVEFNTAPLSGVAIRIYRNTQVDDIENVFYPGSAIRAKDLNDNFTQSLFVIQEADLNVDAANVSADAAVTTANAAVVTANTAETSAAAAQVAAAQAQTDATKAAADAAAAQADATQAATDATAAQVSANQANAAVQAAAIFAPVANVAAIPATPADQDRVSVLDSTGIASFTPLTGLPVGAAYDSGIYVNLVYQTTGATWVFVAYGPNDPDSRYLLDTANSVSTSNITNDAVTTDKVVDDAVTPAKLDRAYVDTTGGTMTGALNVPAGASGTEAPQAQEVVKKSGDSITGPLTLRSWLTVLPVGGTGNGLGTGVSSTNGLSFNTPDEADRAGAIASQVSGQSATNISLSKKGPSTTGAKYINFAFSGSQSGSITVQSSTSINYNATSDYRLKENVAPIAGAASILNQLKPCRYNFISNPELPMLGFLAHEVQEVLPSVVVGKKDAVDKYGKDDYQQMDYSKLTPILTAALQEALTRIETLEAKVQTLENN